MEYTDSIDFDKFLPMLNDCFPSEELDEITFINNVNNGNYIFAKLYNNLCGYVLFDHSTSVARLIHLCIIDSYQRQGLGGQLLNKLLGILQEGDCTKLILNVDIANTGAIKLYRKFGFTTESTQFQYSVILTEHKEPTGECYIEEITEPDLDHIRNRFHLGSTFLAYSMASKITELYKIMDQQQTLQGYLAYSKNIREISMLHLDRPELVSDVLSRFAIFLKNTTSIRVLFTSDGIAKYIEQYPGVVFDYELLVMARDLTTTIPEDRTLATSK